MYLGIQFPELLWLELLDLIVALDTEPQGGGLAGTIGDHTVVQSRILHLSCKGASNTSFLACRLINYIGNINEEGIFVLCMHAYVNHFQGILKTVHVTSTYVIPSSTKSLKVLFPSHDL